MTAVVPVASPRPAATRSSVITRLWRRRASPLTPLALAMPATILLIVFLVVPTLRMITYSFSGIVEAGVYQPGWTLENYRRLVAVDLYVVVLWRTLRVAALTSLVCVVLAYPLALAIARGTPAVARTVTMVLVAPLLVNVVIRSYGWSAVLSRQGALNWALEQFGLISSPLLILYTETAVLIASVHVFLAFMVLPLAAALGRIDPAVERAASVLGAPPWRVFLRVTVPLSLPGLAVGVSLVFSLTAAAYVTPQILGGNFAPFLGTLIEQQILTLHDWPFGAALSSVLVFMVLMVNVVFLHLAGRRFAAWTEVQR